MPANSGASGDPASQPSHDQVSARARTLWKERGQPGGRDLEFWLDAERQLRDEFRGRAAPPKPPATPTARERQDPVEAEKRLDGLVQRKPSPSSRTPKGEQL